MKNVHDRILLIREQILSLSQKDLAARLCVSRSAVAQWESRGNISPANVAKLAELSGKSAEWITSGADSVAESAPNTLEGSFGKLIVRKVFLELFYKLGFQGARAVNLAEIAFQAVEQRQANDLVQSADTLDILSTLLKDCKLKVSHPLVNDHGAETHKILARIKSRLTALNLSRHAASMRAGKSDAIRNMQRALKNGGRQGVNLATITALATALETSVSWLVEGHGPEEVSASHSTNEPPLVTMEQDFPKDGRTPER